MPPQVNNLAITHRQRLAEHSKKKPLHLNKTITGLADAPLKEYVLNKSNKFYNKEAKELQVNTVCNLVHDNHSFVLAGTSYGKTRIGKIYFRLFPTGRKPVVLVLNPLDSLRDNQVSMAPPLLAVSSWPIIQ
jgi:hypothetical protein